MEGGQDVRGEGTRLRRVATISTCELVTADEVAELVARDVVASDMMYSILYAAIRSYRRDTLLRYGVSIVSIDTHSSPCT